MVGGENFFATLNFIFFTVISFKGKSILLGKVFSWVPFFAWYLHTLEHVGELDV